MASDWKRFGAFFIVIGPAHRLKGALLVRGTDQRYRIALVAAIKSKIAIDGDYAVFEMHFAHPDQAQVGEIRFAVGIAFCQSFKLRQMIVAIKGERHELLFDELQYRGTAA